MDERDNAENIAETVRARPIGLYNAFKIGTA